MISKPSVDWTILFKAQSRRVWLINRQMSAVAPVYWSKCHSHRVIILNRGSMPRMLPQGRKTSRERKENYANFPNQNVQRHSVTSLENARSLDNGPSWGGGAEGEMCILRSPGIAAYSISLLSIYGMRVWAELNGGENYLHWKANMFPLFSIMTLWSLSRTSHWRTVTVGHTVVILISWPMKS